MKSIHLHSRSAPSGRRIGLLGGSFNPAHAGHLAVSQHALRRLGLDQIWWLVSKQNPLKSSIGMAPLAERLKKAQSTVISKKIIVTDIEQKLGTRYTVDTLKALKKHYPTTQFVWLMGADNMQQVSKWRQWQAIFQLVPVAVFRRPTYGVGRRRGKAAIRFDRYWVPARRGKNFMQQKPPVWLVLDNKLNPWSASFIRQQHI